MAKATPNYDDFYIKVYPRSAGDFGMVTMSGIKYNKDDAEDLAKDMIQDIKRHVDRVRYTDIAFDSWICSTCKEHWDLEQEAEDCCEEETVLPN